MKTEIDIVFFEHFIYRLGMYVQPVTKETVISFIHGYAAGKENREFTEVISERLEKKFGIKKPAAGWP